MIYKSYVFHIGNTYIIHLLITDLPISFKEIASENV